MHSVCLLFIKAATNCFLNLWSTYFMKWQKIVKKCQRFSYWQYSTTLHWFLFEIYIAYTFLLNWTLEINLKQAFWKKDFIMEKKNGNKVILFCWVKFESFIQLFPNVLGHLGYSPCFTQFMHAIIYFIVLLWFYVWLFNTFWLHNLQSQNILDLLTETMN